MVTIPHCLATYTSFQFLVKGSVESMLFAPECGPGVSHMEWLPDTPGGRQRQTSLIDTDKGPALRSGANRGKGIVVCFQGEGALAEAPANGGSQRIHDSPTL